MHPLLALKVRMALNSFRHPDRPGKRIFFFLLGAFFLTGLYFWVRRIFLYLVSIPLIGDAALVRFLALLIFIAGAMAALSTMLAAVSTVYTAEEMDMLAVYPVSADILFSVKVLEASFYADWMILASGLPFALAWRSIYDIGVLQALLCAAFFCLFLLTMSFTGAAAATVFCLVFPGGKLRDRALVAFAVVFSGMFFYLKALEPEFIFKADMFSNLLNYLTLLKMPGTLLAPFQWMSRFFITVSSGNYAEAFVISGILLIFFLAAGLVCFLLGSKFLFRITGSIRASGGAAGSYEGAVPSGDGRLIAWKERTAFARNSEQTSQTVILFLLSAIYLFSVYRAPLGDLPGVKNLLSFLNMGAVGLILAAAALRFVFTGMCLDGRYLWLLFSSPLKTETVMKKKIEVYTVYMTASGFLIGIFSGFCFKTSAAFTAATSAICIAMAYTLTRLAAFFAVTYPEYRTDNTARMESSYGGLLFMVAGMFYIASVLAILAYPAYWYMTGAYAGSHVAVKFTFIFAALFLLDNFLFARVPELLAVRMFSSAAHRSMSMYR